MNIASLTYYVNRFYIFYFSVHLKTLSRRVNQQAAAYLLLWQCMVTAFSSDHIGSDIRCILIQDILQRDP